KVEATTLLNRIMFPYIAFVSLAALSMGILNSMNRFAASALGPVVLNIGIITFSFLSGFFPNPAIALAVGVVVGGILQVAIQLPALYHVGWRFRWIWNLGHPAVRKVTTLLVPRLFGIGIVQIDVLVGMNFATALAEGSTT